jgi:signal transduction histidine kinase
MHMQLVGFISFFTLATFLYFSRAKNNTNLWYAGYLFAISLGQLAFLINPTPIKTVAIAQTFHFHEFLARFLSSLSYRFSPYFLLLIGLEISKIIPANKVKVTNFASSLPLLFGYIWDCLFPKEGFIHIYLDFSKNFYILACWATLYTIIGLSLIFYAYFKENNLSIKRQNLLIFILTSPAIGLLYVAYILPINTPFDFSVLHATTGIIIAVTFLILASKFGMMSVKIKIEHDLTNNMISSINSGTSVLNHAVKNKLLIIDIASESLQSVQSEEVHNFYHTLKNSIEQLNQLMKHIQTKTQIEDLITEKVSIASLIHESLTIHQPLFEHEKIMYEFKPEKTKRDICDCDKVHLLEVFSNIFFNSVEAMKEQEVKKIRIELIVKHKHIYIIIRDNGPGISKENLPQVVNPFFSTKRSQNNFGLGLTYCFNVIQRHKGQMRVESKEGEGTGIILIIPKAG